MAAVLARHGRLDVLVNDAAVGLGKALLDSTLEEWNRVMAVNLTGVFLMSRAAVRAVGTQEARCGVASPEGVAYDTSKAGVVYMTRQVAVDYARQRIVCSPVAPGKILTGKTGRAIEPRWIDYSHARTPWPRLGRPEDVAGAALFLASEEATYVTGHNLLVDGGWMAF